MTNTAAPVRVGDIVRLLDAAYPPETAEDWDSVGLTCGDRDELVRKVLFAVDPLPSVVEEALAWDADLLVTHHPLLLRGVHTVATDTWKGRVLHDLVRGGCALYTAHTNADVALGGVNDALAAVLGLRDVEPLRAWLTEPADKLVTFVPPSHVTAVIDAMAAAGAGTIGDYRGCAWTGDGTGTFTPQPGANPHIGTVGVTEVLHERRVEILVPRAIRSQVTAALRLAHPYEEVAIDLFPLVRSASAAGLGRVGEIEADCSLAEFAASVARQLPRTAAGVRFMGPAERRIRRVAVCGGAGDSLLADAAASGADVFVSADLRHHPATEHLSSGGPVLVDAGHWATEWPWLPVAARDLIEALDVNGLAAATVEARVSTLVTDPVTGWSAGH